MDDFSKGINELRDKLIDTSRRNKLINYKRLSKSKNLIIIDESAEFIFNYLVKEEGEFKFDFIPEVIIPSKDFERIDEKINKYKKELEDALKQKDTDTIKLLQTTIKNLDLEKIELRKKASLTAEERAKELGFNTAKELPEIDLNAHDIENKYIDDCLQTLHYPNEMEKILISLERDARMVIEETGSNMLYLILGLLKYNDAKNSEIFNESPLVIIPIILNKKKKNNRYEFSLEYTGDGIDANSSLAEKLKNDYGIILPKLTEEFSYYEYLNEVNEVIKFQKDWSIKHEIAIDFLKFGKILMYLDLDENNWKDGIALSEKEVLKDIFIGKDMSGSSLFAKEYDIDEDKLTNEIPLVMDTDSSQHSAIVDVLNGKNIVIEGPPGTGKSQTISNLIAALLAKGKSVLFMSEKLAALEVVYKRLHFAGVSDFCLELHSHKLKTAKILNSIKQRISTKYESVENIENIIEQIEIKKKELKLYIDLLHKRYGAINKKVYDIFWLVEKYNKSSKYLKYDVPNANEYNAKTLDDTIQKLQTYQNFLKEYNDFNDFYWKGLDVFELNFIDIDTFIITLKSLKNFFINLEQQYKSLNVDIKNEYTQSRKICAFMENFTKINYDYSKDILFNLSQNSNLYDEYLANFKDLKISINDIKNDIENLNNYSELFEQIIINILKIDKILEYIKDESGLSNNKNIEYINQLYKGIKHLSKVDKNLYNLINSNYLDMSFLKEFNNIKQDLEYFNQLKNGLSSIALIEKVDEITLEKIALVEKIIHEKKDSFLILSLLSIKSLRV